MQGEALMRPLDMNVMDLIDEYTKKDKLPEKQENVRNLLQEFHSRNMLVVAEGIERKEEFDYLVGLGVDLFQGFYLARPS